MRISKKPQIWSRTFGALSAAGLVFTTPIWATSPTLKCRHVAILQLSETEDRLADVMARAGFHHEHVMRTLHRLREGKVSLGIIPEDSEAFRKLLSQYDYLSGDEVALLLREHSGINGLHLYDDTGRHGSAILLREHADLAEALNHEVIHARLNNMIPKHRRSSLALYGSDENLSGAGQLVQEVIAYGYQAPASSLRQNTAYIIFDLLTAPGYRHHWDHGGGEDFIRLLYLAAQAQHAKSVAHIKPGTLWKIASRTDRKSLHKVDKSPGFSAFKAKIWKRVLDADALRNL